MMALECLDQSAAHWDFLLDFQFLILSVLYWSFCWRNSTSYLANKGKCIQYDLSALVWINFTRKYFMVSSEYLDQGSLGLSFLYSLSLYVLSHYFYLIKKIWFFLVLTRLFCSMATPDFVNPISTGGHIKYVHQIILAPLYFQTFLRSCCTKLIYLFSNLK